MQRFPEITRCFIHNTKAAGVGGRPSSQRCPGEDPSHPPSPQTPRERGRAQAAALGKGFTTGRKSQGQAMLILTLLLFPSPVKEKHRVLPVPYTALGCGQSQLCSSETASKQLRLLPTQRKDEFKSNKAAEATFLAPLADSSICLLVVSPCLFLQPSKYHYRRFSVGGTSWFSEGDWRGGKPNKKISTYHKANI